MPTELRIAREGVVATLTFASPDGLNVLSRPTLTALGAALESLAAEPHLRALILRADSQRAFSAGADLRELAALDAEQALGFAAFGQGVAQAIARFPVATIAALDAPAFGGGIEMALACDFRIGTPRARFHYQAAKLGLLPGWGGTQRLPFLVGPARAKRMMLLCEPIEAATALDWGLLDAVDADLEALIGRFCAELTGYERTACIQIKRAINLATHGDPVGEREAFAACFASGRTQEAIRAWLDRTPETTRPTE